MKQFLILSFLLSIGAGAVNAVETVRSIVDQTTLAGTSSTDSQLLETEKATPSSRILTDKGQAPFIQAFEDNLEKIAKEFEPSLTTFSLQYIWKGYVKEFRDNTRSADSVCHMVVAFPNNVTVLAFGFLGNTGAIVFDSTTRKITSIHAWSKFLRDNWGQAASVCFDRTFFLVSYNSKYKVWNLIANVFALDVDGKSANAYQTWEFGLSFSENSSGGSSSSSKRYTMKPYNRDK